MKPPDCPKDETVSKMPSIVPVSGLYFTDLEGLGVHRHRSPGHNERRRPRSRESIGGGRATKPALSSSRDDRAGGEGGRVG